MSKLEDGLNKLGISFSQEQLSQTKTYIAAILKFNESYNLMKADSEDELSVNHILDSLSAYSEIKNLIEKRKAISNPDEFVIGDIGSGGGCPGIPLAIAFPEIKFVLVERMEKRCDFLENAIRQTKLSNVKVFCTQADKVPAESFDIEVFRAFHPFDKKIAKLLLGMLKKGGFIAAYKARSEKIAAEMEEVNIMIPEYKKIALTVPFLEDHERNLVVVQK